ncbi:MAG: hypothetical protein EB168_09485, partial [Euryarchaeota archaeon]|nr:hypothetical protein [Euryarchaeota archaeon]
EPDDEYLNNGEYDAGVIPTGSVDEGIYERLPEDPILPQDYTFFECETDCNYRVTAKQNHDQARVKGILNFSFFYENLTQCGKLGFPTIEWVFDQTLDNGLYTRTFVAQTNLGPWATANNGTYDEDKIAPYIDYVSEGTLSTEDSAGWVGFDDGEYDQPTIPNCEPVQNTSCDVADGGYFSVGSAPDYSDCECPACCLIDGEEYSYSLVKLYPSGTEIADGGIYGRFGSCTIYNNDEFDRDPVNFTCEIDGGTLEDPVPATDVDDEGLYDRVIFDCAECVDSGELILIPCPAEPLNVGVRHLFDEAVWEMKSTVRNSLIPLRTWKNRILDVTNNVPGDGLEYHNPLVADENRGAEPFDSYRHFVRLPLEYPRNGKQWNKAIAVCNNQSYFSAPPSLSETARKPDVARPVLYAVEYNNRDISGATTFYDEDYLVSTNTATFDEIQPGFEDVKISRDRSIDSPFAPSLISSYDPFETRIPNLDGSWKGGYYIYGLDRTLTGYRTTDLEAQHLIELPPSQYPVYDASSLNIPNTELPDDTDQASLKNYVVSYAYFVSDYSAADDPVFDPYTAHCWRTPKIDCLKRDTDENDEPICVEGNLDSRTAYLLHPTN